MQKAIGPVPGNLMFREILPSALSTLDNDTVQTYLAEVKAQLLRSDPIDVITLEQLFMTYVGSRAIDLLSINMYGIDVITITSFKFCNVRPVMICVEFSHIENHCKLLSYLNQRGYRLVTDLGCNLIVEDAL